MLDSRPARHPKIFFIIHKKVLDIPGNLWYHILTERRLVATKTRKVLRITFPTSMSCTLFLWDGNASGYAHKSGSLTELLVEVQRRTERSEMARKARFIYGATTETLVR